MIIIITTEMLKVFTGSLRECFFRIRFNDNNCSICSFCVKVMYFVFLSIGCTLCWNVGWHAIFDELDYVFKLSVCVQQVIFAMKWFQVCDEMNLACHLHARNWLKVVWKTLKADSCIQEQLNKSIFFRQKLWFLIF